VITNIESIITKIQGHERLLSEDHTPEALITEMSLRPIGPPNDTQQKIEETPRVWISDEIAGLFQQLKKKESYMSSIESLLSKLYDGRTFSRKTATKGTEEIRNPYLTCFLASTDYLPTLFQESQLRFGFLHRFIFVNGVRKERKSLRTNALEGNEISLKSDIENFLTAIHEKKNSVLLEMATEAKQLYDNFDTQTESKIQLGNLGVKEGYCGQLPNLVVRLSCLYRISRMTNDEVRDQTLDLLTVNKPDVEKAIAYVNKAWGWFGEVIEIMKSAENQKLSKVDQAKPAIIDMLEDGKEHHWQDIINFVDETVGVKQANTYHALTELVSEGRIEKVKQGYYKIKTINLSQSNNKTN